MEPRPSQPTRVMVVDDHTTFAELLIGALEREPDLVPVGHASTVREAVRMCTDLRPDLVMMDVQLTDGDGFTATKQILETAPSTRVVILTAHSDPAHVARASRAGACAFLPKDGSLVQMLATVRSAPAGGFVCDPALLTRSTDVLAPTTASYDRDASPPSPLTPRETEVLHMLAEGRETRSIARRMGITEETCRGYVKRVLVKLDARTQLQAVLAAQRLGLLQKPDDV